MIVRLGSGVALVLTLAAVIAASGACSSDDAATTSSSSGNGSTSGSAAPIIPTAECNSRCKAKLTTCGAPADQVDQGCMQQCNEGLSEAQATCLESTACTKLGSLASGGSIDTLCPKSTGSSSGSSSTSSTSSSGQSSSSGASGAPPTELTITGTIPSDYKAIHTQTDNSVASLFNVAPQPTFDPDFGINSSKVPELDKASSQTLDSPTRPSGACGTAKFGVVVNSTQIGVQIAGSDDLPAIDCAKFTDSLVAGMKLTLTDVPWPNSSVKSTVHVVLK